MRTVRTARRLWCEIEPLGPDHLPAGHPDLPIPSDPRVLPVQSLDEGMAVAGIFAHGVLIAKQAMPIARLEAITRSGVFPLQAEVMLSLEERGGPLEGELYLVLDAAAASAHDWVESLPAHDLLPGVPEDGAHLHRFVAGRLRLDRQRRRHPEDVSKEAHFLLWTLLAGEPLIASDAHAVEDLLNGL